MPKSTSKSMAETHEKRVGDLVGISGTSSTKLLFRDGSRLEFESNNTKPNPRSVGGINSDAHRFASDVKEFAAIDGKLTFIFKDDSKMEFDISDAIRK